MLYIHRPCNPFDKYDLYRHQNQLIQEWLTNTSQGHRIQRWQAVLPLDSLRETFNYKCAYCEVSLKETKNEELSLFRPYVNATQNRGNDSIENYYYLWLSWEWFNMYLVCKDCFQKKGNCFPVVNRRASPGTHTLKDLSLEEPLLLDPCIDNPNKHLIFCEDGTVKARKGSPRGVATIKILDLNRDDLISARLQEIKSLKKEFQYLIQVVARLTELDCDPMQVAESLRLQYEKDRIFVGMKRQLLLNWLKSFQQYIRQELLRLDRSRPNNSSADKVIYFAMASISVSLLETGFLLNNIIMELEEWFVQPIDSLNDPVAISLQHDIDEVPEWLKDTLLNANTLNEIQQFLDRVKQKYPGINNLSEAKTIIEAELEQPEQKLSSFWSQFNRLNQNSLDRERWIQGAKFALLQVFTDILDNIAVNAFIAFIDGYNSENE